LNNWTKTNCVTVTPEDNLWTSLGSNQGPTDYESGALTN
jgi:hypothetical protein